MPAPNAAASGELSPQSSTEECPQCHQPCGPLTLLTSMTRYYRCAQCGRAWQVRRPDDVAGADSGSSEP